MESTKFNSVALVIPSYNESLVLPMTIKTIMQWNPLPGLSLKEIIIIDDGSSDDTGRTTEKLAEEFSCVRLLRNPVNKGKGFCIRRGMTASESDIIGFTDADLSYDPSQYNSFLREIVAHRSDIVIGSRNINPKAGYHGYSLQRKISNTVFRLIVRTLGLTRASDSQCGIKFFTKKAAKQLFTLSVCNGFAFDVEILYLGTKLNYRISEVPVEMREKRPSTISLRTQAPKMFLDLLKIRLNSGRYSLETQKK